MKDLESRLREQAAREREHRDPGPSFWAELPGATWRAYQAAEHERVRRRHRTRWAALATGLVAAAALVLVIVRPRPGRAPAADPFDLVGAARAAGGDELLVEPSPDVAPFLLDDAAVERLARDIGIGDSTDDVPIEELIEHLSEPELEALAANLGRT